MIHYWNKGNFQGLEQIADNFANDPDLAVISQYCALRAKGLRAQALDEARRFVAAAGEWPTNRRRSAADRVLSVWHENPQVHQLLPHPLVHNFLRPTLEEWIEESPQSAIPLRWLGMITSDRAMLEKALARDEKDDIARIQLIRHFLNDVDYATHHLVEGTFIGSEAQAQSDLDSARRLIDALDHRDAAEGYGSWCDQLQRLLDDWAEYRREPNGSFPDWCKQQGRDYEWPTIVYYDNPSGEEAD